LSIEDGGVNDADGEVNGRLVDPGGIAVNTYLLPDSVNSTIAFSKFSLIANGVDNTTLTVTVRDSNGNPLDGMSVTAVPSLAGVTISSFTAQGNGVYTSTVRAGTSAGTLVVTADVDNGSPNTDTHIQLTSRSLSVRSQNVNSGGGGGGCTVGSADSKDWTLLLLLACLLLYRVRKRYLGH
jgi:adhesin/invasin